MHTAPRHVANAEQGLPKRLALNGEIPTPGFRILKAFALSGHHQSSVTANSWAQCINDAIGHTGVRLERRISSQKYRVTYPKTCNEAPRASADHRLAAHLVGNPRTGLNIAPLNV